MYRPVGQESKYGYIAHERQKNDVFYYDANLLA